MQNKFVGFYDVPGSSGNILTQAIMDALLRFNVPADRLSGVSFDTAANMSGVHKGVQARIKEKNPCCLYVPCSNHCLDLILQEASREVTAVATAINFVKGVANLVNDSANRTGTYRATFSLGETPVKLLGICGTRWCVRAGALKRLLEQYPRVLETLTALEADKGVPGDTRAKIGGLLESAQSAKTFVTVSLVHKIMEPCEIVAAALQGVHSSSLSVEKSIGKLKTKLEGIRNGGLEGEMAQAQQKADELKLVYPEPKRRTKTPAKIRQDNVTKVDEAHGPLQEARRDVLEALDVMMSQLDSRFDNEGLYLAARREEGLLETLDPSNPEASFDDLRIPPSIDVKKLSQELSVLSASFSQKPTWTAEVLRKLTDMPPGTRVMFGEVVSMLSLICTVPSTAASSERTFSMLRRLKTYTRNRCSQSRLNHLALADMHKSVLTRDAVKKMEVRFASKTSERKKVFGYL